VIVVEGINDIGEHVASAAQVIAADKQLIAQAHAAGLAILGGTLTPFQGAGYYSPAAERVREQVNAWIRTGGAFDGVVDFDKALRDPADPPRLARAYDSGDHLHPSDAGYKAMAAAVDLSLLR
jgi:lysophospholipase L1-like esterase